MSKYCLGLSTNPGRKIHQTSKPHSSCSLSRRHTGEDKLILANSNTNEKMYGTNFFSQGSHLAPSEETNSKHPPQRCQPKEKESSSKAQHVAFHCLRKLLPFRCRCSTKVVIPQLTDLIRRQKPQLALPREETQSIQYTFLQHQILLTRYTA